MLQDKVVRAVNVRNISVVPFEGGMAWVANNSGRLLLSLNKELNLTQPQYIAYIEGELYVVAPESSKETNVLLTLEEITISSTVYSPVSCAACLEVAVTKIVTEVASRTKEKKENEHL